MMRWEDRTKALLILTALIIALGAVAAGVTIRIVAAAAHPVEVAGYVWSDGIDCESDYWTDGYVWSDGYPSDGCTVLYSEF